MSKLLEEELFKSIGKSPRGGYYMGIGYDSCGFIANRFHYVCDGAGNSLTDISKLPVLTRLLFAELTEKTREIAIDDFGAVIGETCIRVLWYPQQTTDLVRSGEHQDFCWLSVPLFDSTAGRVSPPFYGKMAEHTGDGIAQTHSFHASSISNRLYIVGFVQLPFNTICDGRRIYADVLNEIVAANNSGGNKYNSNHGVL